MSQRGARRVAVLGGGMGGLSCAHELSRRPGVQVAVYEASDALGGKARSQYLPGTGTGGRRDLPGEHGFRFYPAFYRHVIATMDEIPDAESRTGTVAGNLAAAPEGAAALDGQGVVVVPRKLRTPSDLLRSIAAIWRVGGSVGDLAWYLGANLKYLTACDTRRDRQWEARSWASFIGAEEIGRYSEGFREVLLACTRTMVAMDARRGSTRSVGRASSLLLADSFGDRDIDRTMTGPTTECWIDPWQAELDRRGVEFRFGQRVCRIELDPKRREITRVWVRDARGHERPVEADAFVLAVPIEVAQRLMTPALANADVTLWALARLDLAVMTDWMVGAQFFLREDVPLCAGHLFFPKSPWALTAISQAQFWNRGARRMSRYGDGHLRGILSVDVSNCFAPDRDGVRFVDGRTRQEILRRIWQQILEALDGRTRARLARSVYAMHLDTEVRVGANGVENAGCLLVHPPGSWYARPEAVTAVRNLFLAADYVRTTVDIASMEGANEAGRRAAIGVRRHLELDAGDVKLFDYGPLHRFRIMRGLDRRLYDAGLPHLFDMGENVMQAVGNVIGKKVASLARAG